MVKDIKKIGAGIINDYSLIHLLDCSIESSPKVYSYPGFVEYSYYYYLNSIIPYIQESDKNLFGYLFEYDSLIEKIKSRDKVTMVFDLKLNSDEYYRPYQFEVIKVDNECCDYILTWKKIDEKVCLLEESIKLLGQSYLKIVKVNLTQDSYEVIKIGKETISTNSFSSWTSKFVELENVYYEDINDFLSFININNLKTLFVGKNDNKAEFRYRRLCNGTYRWVLLEILPAREYKDDNQVIMIYIRDIHNDFVFQLEEKRKLIYYSTHDMLTSLNNRLAYMEKISCADYDLNVGVIYVELNNTDKEFVKEAVNNIILSFKAVECFRISDDEIVILLDDIDKSTFENKVNKFKENFNYGLIGYAYSEKGYSDFNKLISQAQEILK